ncbi:RNA polymerase factor sigma-54 [Candidatus Macondimonas diazotrophica]|jgi:RNA polymerase sigma-54 factor|uniref:RNA polymerase sigma-54 factor n=1 Tax=Candidatus Macondimonas diazotrophica TaxID=2305248 RepID=A0A4Z0FB13_9GAMM|nr:RNA polymerase factor sigma-54 [Candidatus Macondimonas diazotrophica]NCT99896.1 RNA polymerase factor sigma-54 [Candidatus Macondimonas diazotrophica]TFZ83706.1 RNA polymerase factor sigma-54 [Candidatus Macondimonas diazotrophica]HBG29721.1 RNA polymerase factor sigma-54 [Gammaproteobacteria bacterium]HBG50189.1 RNA polymerase factor sigma-54 [Gammaproteobacteria bacterium]
MKQTLHLKMGQRLAMTPQLQQAIRLLQLSSIELQQEIQTILDNNLMIENGSAEGSDTAEDAASDYQETAGDSMTGLDASAEAPTDARGDDLDLAWEDPWSQGEDTVAGSGEAWDFNQTPSQDGGELRDHLIWQMRLGHFSETDEAIALAIIDAINDDGYLTESLDALVGEVGPDLATEPAEILAVLQRIQGFDPLGVGARDLREALLLQLKAIQPSDVLPLACELVEHHLDLLANRDFATLQRRLKTTEDGLRAAIELIQRLNPRPGAQISQKTAGYVIPDVIVRRSGTGWRVDLNTETTPKLRINRLYASLIKRADSSRDNETMRQHLQEARWFLKSLQSRNETLFKVASSIVERQQAFFDHGEEAMQPMVLREIAEAVGMHESTISRVTNQKYMHTPRGIFEFKYFFSSHVTTVDGGECSATAIQAMIRKLIAAENPRKPLSDSKLTEMLLGNGINVARRTVAKYRESMSIPPSNERKRLV